MSHIGDLALSSLCILGITAAVAAQVCPSSESPSDSPCLPRTIPGSPGVYDVVMDVNTAMPDFASACGFNPGHTVWFEVTPAKTGPVSISTCRPATTYDTILQVWKGTSDCEFPERLDDLCVDDSEGNACRNACSLVPRASNLTFHATANTRYLIEVGSFNANSGGCNLCLGLRVVICRGDGTPPISTISSPAESTCVCGPTPVVGTVGDPESGLLRYDLDYRKATDATWTAIAQGDTPVTNGTLGTWDTSGLSQGYYFFRLQATNGCGLSETSVRSVWLDVAFDTLAFRSPAPQDVVGGRVCLEGTLSDAICFDDYTATFRPAGGGSFIPVDPAHPVYLSEVVNDLFAEWDTLSLPDGVYELRAQGTTVCGYAALQTLPVTVDNTPPTAIILEPLQCNLAEGMVQVVGTASDANLAGWTLQYTGGDVQTWTTIATGTVPVIDGVLGTWNTQGLRRCAYTLRLVATDRARLNCSGVSQQRSEYLTTIELGVHGQFDYDGDGDVDQEDFGVFQRCTSGADVPAAANCR